MNRITVRTRRVAAATATLAALGGAALLSGGVASAAPVSPTAPVPGTQCNVGQVERATAKVAPEFWKHVSAHPKAKDRFEQFLVQTPQQRAAAKETAKKAHRAKIDEWRKAHPGQKPPAHPHQGKNPTPAERKGHPKMTKQQVEQKIAQVKATCASS